MLKRVTEVRCSCSCGWIGTVLDAEPDIDGEGSLGCLACGHVLFILVPDCPQIIDPGNN